jgi:sulfoxide reductase catalytic subunit YedY
MLIKKPSDINPSEITPESVYRNRRQFIEDSGKLLLGAAAASTLPSIANAQTGAGLMARAPASMRRSE